MTLLIALIANHICEHLTGEVFLDTGWIVAIWVAHVLYHSGTKS